MAIVQGKNCEFLVDDQDLPLIDGLVWEVVQSGRVSTKSLGAWVTLHRFIVRHVPDGMVVDHINGNPLDNRRANLRVCTRAQNSQNVKRRSSNKSGYKGVSWDSERGKWVAKIAVENKDHFLGRFDSKEAAAMAYAAASLNMHGPFGRDDTLIAGRQEAVKLGLKRVA